MRIVMIGPFGMRPRSTMSVRALPLAKALVERGHGVTLLLPPWQNPEDAGKAWDDRWRARGERTASGWRAGLVSLAVDVDVGAACCRT